MNSGRFEVNLVKQIKQYKFRLPVEASLFIINDFRQTKPNTLIPLKSRNFWMQILKSQQTKLLKWAGLLLNTEPW
jgi:hypothetical protein